jgi:SAM-dependent methyltransferase
VLLSRAVPKVYQFKDFAGSSHRILLALVRQHARGRRRILDLGAAGGELGAALQGEFEQSIGFELDVEEMAVLKQRFTHIVIGDLERLTALPPDCDAIVLADVLEHLREPAALLRLAHGALAPGGRLFISVPNIANVTIRLGLLLGVFTYRDRGILDHTHLRFYTLKTIRREVEHAGFRIETMRGSAIPVRLIIGRWTPEFLLRPAETLLAAVTQWWKALLAYQFIIVARPRR